MDATLISVAALVGGLIGWFIKSLFKGPRELQGDAERRILSVENRVTALELSAASTYSRHDERLVTLTQAIEKLTDRFEKFAERFGNGNRGGN